jgi:cyclase
MKHIFLTVATLLFFNITHHAHSQEACAECFQIREITSGVYTAHPKGPISRINVTSTIIVGSEFLTVIESQPDKVVGKHLISAIRQHISKLPIRYLIYTHFHLDHILGADAFIAENPAITIVGHDNITKYAAGIGSSEKKSWAEFLSKRAAETESEAKLEKNSNRLTILNEQAHALREFSKDVTESSLVPPDITFSDSLVILNKPLTMILKYVGKGHTSSDIIIYIPERKVLVSGDLVHDFEPLFSDANPDEWIKILSGLKTIKFDFLIGGHGNVNMNTDVLSLWLNYILELKVKTQNAISEGKSLQDFKNSISAKSITTFSANSYGEEIQSHRSALMTDRFIGSLDDAIWSEINTLWTFYGGKK